MALSLDEAVTVRRLTAADSGTLLPGEEGIVISVPSEASKTGTAYVAFAVKAGGALSSEHVRAAAYSLADFNADLSRVREYELAIRRFSSAH